MQFRDILITGGAGFVGGHLARTLKAVYSDARVTALDNLKRRGSELNLPLLAKSGVRFVHGDVRNPEDLRAVGDVDLIIDCAAEPAASAGLDGSTQYVVQTNLVGTVHCLELARQRGAAFLLLSTSRVYSIPALNALPYRETESRFELDASSPSQGFSNRGVAESFPLTGPRSLYGASKLSAELFVAEYAHAFGVKALIDRCGVIAGPGQMSRADQGVITHFIASHFYNRPLAYIGFGGTGKQVRDVLHVDDLFALVQRQLAAAASWDGAVYNVGGGPERTLSLRELTALCVRLTHRRMAIGSRPETSPVDVRIFVTDSTRVERTFDWKPVHSVEQIVTDIHAWIDANADSLRAVLTC